MHVLVTPVLESEGQEELGSYRLSKKLLSQKNKGGREGGRKDFSFINETIRWFIRGIIQVYRLERNTDKRAWIENKAKHPSVASEIA